MTQRPATPRLDNQPGLMIGLGLYAALGCVIFALSVLIADVVVPDHDWIADTISDLGAGRYEYIVDIGLYSFSASLIALAILAAHVHMDGTDWSLAIVGLACLGLIVFLVGARNEYGDDDSDGWIIHSYLVYALGLLMAAVPLLLYRGARRCGAIYGRLLLGTAAAWILTAPWFFFLPTGIDGIYERGLGLIAMVMVLTLSHLFVSRGRAHRAA